MKGCDVFVVVKEVKKTLALLKLDGVGKAWHRSHYRAAPRGSSAQGPPVSRPPPTSQSPTIDGNRVTAPEKGHGGRLENSHCAKRRVADPFHSIRCQASEVRYHRDDESEGQKSHSAVEGSDDLGEGNDDWLWAYEMLGPSFRKVAMYEVLWACSEAKGFLRPSQPGDYQERYSSHGRGTELTPSTRRGASRRKRPVPGGVAADRRPPAR